MASIKQFSDPLTRKKSQPIPTVQRKLKVGSPNDKSEQEADNVADKVMRMPANEEQESVNMQPQEEEEKVAKISRQAETEEEDPSMIKMQPEEEEKSAVSMKPEEEEASLQKQEDEELQKQADDEEKVNLQSEEEENPSIQKQEDEEIAKQDDEEDKLNMQTEEEETSINKQNDDKKIDKQAIEEEETSISKASEDKEEVNLKSTATSTRANYAPSRVVSQINASQSGGQALPKKANTEFSQKMGKDFSNVKIHNDSRAVQMNKDLSAKAFTHKNHIYFNQGQFSPSNSEGKRLLAHELTHVVQQKGERLIQRRALTRAERRAAITHTRGNFDEMSVRIIQNTTGLAGADIDGAFGKNTARALSDYQTAHPLAPDNGIVNEATLNAMTANRVLAGRRNQAIHLVTDFYNLNLSDTLSVYFQAGATRVNPTGAPANFPADTDFDSGGLRVIRIGAGAFTNAPTLRDTVQRELSRVAPVAAGPAAPHGGLLTRRQVKKAVRYMNRHYKDRRSIMALQGQFVGVNSTGIVDADLVQRIADVQDTTPALALVDGKVGRNTLEHFFVQLRDGGSEDAAIRLVMDFYNMPDYDNLLAIYYEAPVGAGTNFRTRVPVRIRLGLALFLPFAAMVHTLRHELEHVGNLKEGITNINIQEFLSEALEVISTGMSHETLLTVVAGGLISGFQHDANRMMDNWDFIPTPAEQRRYWRTFRRARRVIRRRIARTYGPTRAADQAEWVAATPAQQAALIALLARVNAESRP